MRKITAIANQKGGVGKTTTAVNLAAGLALAGRRVILVDCDPQGNAGSSLGVHDDGLPTLYEALIDEAEVASVIRPTTVDGLRIIPSGIKLIGAEVELLEVDRREFRLRELLTAVGEEVDNIILDCPPSLGLITINALTAAESLVIPLQCEYFGLEGLSRLVTTVQRVRERLNPTLRLSGVLLTMVSHTNLSLQVMDEVRRHFGNKVFKTAVPRNVRLGEAPSHGLPVALYDSKSSGALAYACFTEEFLQHEEESSR